jgi:hypothetical protein
MNQDFHFGILGHDCILPPARSQSQICRLEASPRTGSISIANNAAASPQSISLPGANLDTMPAALDDERKQVGSDLIASGAVRAVELIPPLNRFTSGVTATGGEYHIDAKLLAVDLESGAAKAHRARSVHET